MGDVIKFRAAKKKLDRKAKEKTAEKNRAFHGLTKAERDAAKAVKTKQDETVDGHKRED